MTPLDHDTLKSEIDRTNTPNPEVKAIMHDIIRVYREKSHQDLLQLLFDNKRQLEKEPPTANDIENQNEETANLLMIRLLTGSEIGRTIEDREGLIDDIIREGGVYMNMSVPNEYSTEKRGSGFCDIVDPKRRTTPGLTARIYNRFKQIEVQLRKSGINEAVVIEPYTDRESRTETTYIERKRLFGTKRIPQSTTKIVEVKKSHREVVENGKDEEAYSIMYRTYDNSDNPQYRDYSGRWGQYLAIEIAIPKSLAEKVSGILQKDPTFIRRIIDKIVAGRLIPERAWHLGDDLTKKIPLRPPYEKWSGKIYLQQAESNTFDEKRIHTE